MGNGETCKQVILSIFATLVLQLTLDFINLPSCSGKAAVQPALCDSVTYDHKYLCHTLKRNYIFLFK